MRHGVVASSFVFLLASASGSRAEVPVPALPQSAPGNHAHRVDELFGPPYNLDGSGVTVALFDLNWVDDTHPDFGGRVVSDRTLPVYYPPQPDSDHGTLAHATHMAGVMVGGGTGNAAAKGAAPNARLHSYLIDSYQAGDAKFIASEVALHGWKVANHSYGSGSPCTPPPADGSACNPDEHWATYIDVAHDEDVWAHEHDVLSINASGNKGLYRLYGPGFEDGNWSTIYGGGTAKNAITVCASDRVDFHYMGLDFVVATDSSKGPASDGRIKPEVCAVGYASHDLTTELGGGYAATGATSEAAAQVSGIVALLHQVYRNANGADTTLPAALARAVVIHTADDMGEATAYFDGNKYVTTHAGRGPDYVTGFGFVDAKAAADALLDRSRYMSAKVATAETSELELTVPARSELKVTVAWVDPPAAIDAAVALINDLDLEVVERDGGAVHLPWVLDKTHPANAATTGVNHVDNVEQVVFANEAETELAVRVRVKGTSVPMGPQTFHLVHSTTALPMVEMPPEEMPPVTPTPPPTMDHGGCNVAVGAGARGAPVTLVFSLVALFACLRRRRA